MHVHDLSPAPGSTKNPKRVGRGIGGKGGKTAGRGTKGQYARNTVARGFEGGQMPLKQRVPKLKGFTNPFRVEYTAINLDTLSELGESTVDPEVLLAHGLVRKDAFVKVLARGEVTAKLDVHVHAVSKAAEAAIVAAGGSVTLFTNH
jgi:large subunit ribosomal protein L15